MSVISQVLGCWSIRSQSLHLRTPEYFGTVTSLIIIFEDLQIDNDLDE